MLTKNPNTHIPFHSCFFFSVLFLSRPPSPPLFSLVPLMIREPQHILYKSQVKVIGIDIMHKLASRVEGEIQILLSNHVTWLLKQVIQINVVTNALNMARMWRLLERYYLCYRKFAFFNSLFSRHCRVWLP